MAPFVIVLEAHLPGSSVNFTYVGKHFVSNYGSKEVPNLFQPDARDGLLDCRSIVNAGVCVGLLNSAV
jgi:hypothetical protein